MLSPGDFSALSSPEDAYLELLNETLEGMDRQARGQFLQHYLKSIAQLELSEDDSLQTWDRILARRTEMAQVFSKPVSLKTAMIDVLASSGRLRVPILMEYEELKKLQINAATDPLTGLYNRRLFEENFDRELNRARRYSHKLVLVMLDLHQFKGVNDRHGHLAGDQLLRGAASTLRKSLRTSDYAFRIGGDEFALLLPESDAEQALTLSRRVRANYAANISALHLGISPNLDYGIAVYPDDAEQKEALIRTADERLYRLKQTGLEEARNESKPGVRESAPRPQQPEAAVKKSDSPVRETAAAASSTARQSPTEPRREPPGPQGAPSPRTGERRRWERVSLAGTRASAGLGESSQKTARILDLGYGGVAIETHASDELSDAFTAILNVPILPPVRVSLKRVYVSRVAGTNRIGCAFVT
jgi:diguanylate cyclase (GGDEF)-like protein